ncbi:hypothetical membrane protein [Gemmatimonas aurantiaca T-27]|nr:TPM domain-containing protein [Gemmatimonas aurantiaca]BAH37769.1 hypothetical membrane protein [Gemmatimonas aurantiaca T-27]
MNSLRRSFGALTLVAALLVASTGPFVATVAAQAPNTALPQPVGYVNDFARVLAPEASGQIESLAQRVHAATRGDMVVVTLPDLGGRPVEEVALRLGREWKVGSDAQVGDAARNAGVIILLVPKETSTDGRGYCRVETGQGAEGFITDATAGALCRSVTPLFQARDYSGALVQLSAQVADRYARAFGVTLDGLPEPQRARRRTNDEDSPFATIVLIVIIVIVVSSMNGRRRGCVGCIPLPIPGGPMMGGGGHGSWGGGGFGGGGGGGFGGFGGGGGFSGGGGGSNW